MSASIRPFLYNFLIPYNNLVSELNAPCHYKVKKYPIPANLKRVIRDLEIKKSLETENA